MTASDDKDTELWPGQVVRLVSRAQSGEEEEAGAVIERVEDGSIEITTECRIGEGHVVTLQRSVRDDARYVLAVETDPGPPGRYLLTALGDWERVQEREFVRVSTHGMEVKVERTQPPPAKTDTRRRRLGAPAPKRQASPMFPLVNLSAGGLRFEARETFELDEPLQFELSLAEVGELKLTGRVLRIEQPNPNRASLHVAVVYKDLEEDAYEKLTRWVFGEEARRLRERNRD